MTGTARVFSDAASLAMEAAKAMEGALSSAIRQKGHASIALSGGSTPHRVYEHLGNARLEWSRVHVFWGDERCVPHNSPESNYRMARLALLDKVKIPHANIHPVATRLSPQNAAREYEKVLRDFFASDGSMVDVMLLGLGEDGHTASLFPGTDAVAEQHRWVVDVFVPRLLSRRVTMTFPAINASRSVFFLVSGNAKAEIVREVLESRCGVFPAESVVPSSGELFWYLDSAAASLLSRKEHA